jgi:fructosamine-3-kinase
MRTTAHPNELATNDTGPSEEWTPEQQIARMLELCEAQMESALSESDVAVDALIKAFTSVTESQRSLGDLLEKLPPRSSDAEDSELGRQLAHVHKQMAHAVVAFQFYDKLTQRLGHVRYSLSTLAMFVCDNNQTRQREQWERLFGTLRRLYRTQEERDIFQLMVEGASGAEARAQAEHHTEPRDPDSTGEIELF